MTIYHHALIRQRRAASLGGVVNRIFMVLSVIRDSTCSRIDWRSKRGYLFGDRSENADKYPILLALLL